MHVVCVRAERANELRVRPAVKSYVLAPRRMRRISNTPQ